MNVLFVCSGNISRSFLAERLAGEEIEKRGVEEIAVSSAGLHVYPGNPPDSKMVEYLKKLEIPANNHEPKQMTKEDADWADLILVMEIRHAKKIERLWPEMMAKVQLLGKYVSNGRDIDDVIDPFGRSAYHYRLAQSQISLAVKTFFEKLSADLNRHN